MYRILLVDDEALIREAVSENVDWSKYGYELVGALENGREALEFIKENPVDVVLTDICMPYLDGMELSKRLSEEYPEIKVIILSGYDEFDYAKKAIKYGVKEYLLKPITAVEMGETLLALKQEMDREMEEKEKISAMWTNYHKGQLLVRNKVLLDLIMGSKTEQENRSALEQFSLCLDALGYRVGIVELDVYTRGDKLCGEQKKESALMAFVLYNISQEIVKKHGAGEVCQGQDHRSYILFYSNKPVEMRRRVKTVCDEIILHMNQVMQLEVNIGLGSCMKELGDIDKSCGEAEKALGYHYLLGGNRIFEMEVIRQEKEEVEVDELLEVVLLHIKENAPHKIISDMEELKELFINCRCDRQSIRTVLQRSVDAIWELRRNLELSDQQEKSRKERTLREILNADKMAEAVELLQRLCIETGEILDNNKNVYGKKYAVLAMDYLEKNYANCNLNLQLVCSYLNISPSYFSSVFKAATGTTFMDALSSIRMQKAKELLEDSGLKNYEIAERVGFNDPHYFSIAFKKATGKSPMEYAKEMRSR